MTPPVQSENIHLFPTTIVYNIIGKYARKIFICIVFMYKDKLLKQLFSGLHFVVLFGYILKVLHCF